MFTTVRSVLRKHNIPKQSANAICFFSSTYINSSHRIFTLEQIKKIGVSWYEKYFSPTFFLKLLKLLHALPSNGRKCPLSSQIKREKLT